jgi:hypothetical protein
MDEQQRAEYEATLAMVMEMVDGAYGTVVSSIERQEKLKWLEDFITAPIAWNVAVELLTRPRYQVFAANALTKKISASWSSLLKEHKKELCDVVLSTISDSQTAVSLQSSLCSTVTQIILQSTPHDWPDPISDTLHLSQLDPSQGSDTRHVWIQLVKTLAEGVNQSPMNSDITMQQHENLKKYLKDVSADHVVKVLLAIMEENCMDMESTLASEALSAMVRWYELGPEITSTTTQTVESVVEAMLANPVVLVTSGAEVILEVLNLFSLAKYPQTVQHMLEVTLRLEVLVAPAIAEEDEDLVISLLSVFAAFGTNHPSAFIKNPTNGLRVCQAINACCQVKEAINSELVDFWDSLHKELAPDSDFDDLLDIYRPAIIDMVRIMLDQCRRTEEDDVESEMQLNTRRRDAGELLHSYYSMIPEEELETLYVLLEDSLTSYERQPTPEAEAWVEVALWGWSSLTEEFVDEEEWPLKLLKLFESLPQTLTIQKTAMNLIGSLAHWLATHEAAIPVALDYVITSLENADIADMATNSLTLICDQCGDSLPPLLAELLDKLESIMGALTSKQQCKVISCLANQVTYLDPNQGLSLLVRLAGDLPETLLTLTQETNHFNLLQRGRLIDGLNFISAVLVSPWDPMETPASERSVTVMHCHIAPKMTPNERYNAQVEWARIALAPLVDQTWPIAEAIVNGADLDEEFCTPVLTYIERVSSSLKRFVCAEYVPKALVLLYTMFERTGSVKVFRQYNVFCGLYRTHYNTVEISRLVEEEHGHIVELGLVPPAPSASIANPPCELVSHFANAFATFSNLALQLLQEGTGAEEIELVQYYYHYCVTPTLQHMPRAFFANVDCVVAISQFASNVLPALHRQNDLRHLVTFFRLLFGVDVSNAMSTQECNEFQDFKAKLFEVMLTNIFTALGGVSPRSTIPIFGEMVHYYLITYPELATATIAAILQRPGFPTPNIPQERKQQFLGKIIQATRSPESMSAVLHDFSVVCRGMESTFLASIRPTHG